jgi:acetyl-CoA decarbonylase/synthase complex subunit gamma
MGLTGIQIFKLLPKTNCKECGVPTCLAFAMNLAGGKAELSACPYVSDEAKASLSEASAPPIRPVEIGAGASAFKTGGELVMFRHEKTFFNPTGLALRISDSDSAEQVDQKLKCFADNQYDRVGLTLKGDLFALKAESGNADTYAALVKKVRDASDAGLILWSDNPDMVKAGLAERGGSKVLIYGANKGNLDAMTALAKEHGAPLVLMGDGLDEIKELSEAATKAGLKDLVFDTGARTAGDQLRDQTAIRRLALQAKDRAFGFPTIAPVCDMAETPAQEAVIAAAGIAKYAGIVILSDFQGEYLFPLLLERLNIYTDPQRPMKTEEGLYALNDATADSPVVVTSNFSLTYFIVSGEIENSRIPCWLFVKDTDGLSVLTAWAAGKFVGDAIGEAMKKKGCNDKVNNKKIVIPGLAAIISGDLEEELGSDWEVMIGPREASFIPAFLKQNFA